LGGPLKRDDLDRWLAAVSTGSNKKLDAAERRIIGANGSASKTELSAHVQLSKITSL